MLSVAVAVSLMTGFGPLGSAVAQARDIVVLGGRIRFNTASAMLSELTLIYLLFRLVPPLLAFGVYFNLTHSARHVCRVWWQLSKESATAAAAAGGNSSRNTSSSKKSKGKKT